MDETRQQKRQQQREEFKKQEAMRKQMSSNVTKAEMYQLMELFNRLRDRMFHLDIFSSAIEKVLIDKGLATREEIEESFKFEGKRAAKFNEISNQQGDYKKRLDICKEWNIDPSITQIPDQMMADKELSDDERMKFAVEYNITRLIEIEENKKKIEEEARIEQEKKDALKEQKDEILNVLDQIGEKKEEEQV